MICGEGKFLAGNINSKGMADGECGNNIDNKLVCTKLGEKRRMTCTRLESETGS